MRKVEVRTLILTEEQIADLRAATVPDPRLQQLREEFEAARSELVQSYRGIINRSNWLDVADKRYFIRMVDEMAVTEPDDCHDFVGLKYEPLKLAARRYIIARDFNEFDPERALMLWKLQKQ